jgi:uncharacterized protein YbaP (TraB family)
MRSIINRFEKFSTAFTWLVWGIAGVKMMLVASFFVVLSQASASLAENKAAENVTKTMPPIVCKGENLLAQLEKDDPGAFSKIEEQAQKVLNGSTRFWKIEKAGLPTSWLLGTMHFSDPRVVNIPDAVERAFAGANTVVIENTQILDPEALAAAMVEVRPMMFFTDGSTLEDRYGKETIELLKARLKGRTIPYFLGKRMQPWVLATAIVMPMCEIERKNRKQKVLDFVLGERALSEGKTLIGLESVKEQISAMASLTLEFHLKSLEETVRLGDKIDDMMETMVQLYVAGDVGKFWPLMEHLSPKTSKGPGYAQFQEALITRRNKVMADRANPQLEKGGVFMAVGALHLPGKLGVVQLLSEAGYTVTPAL